MFSLGGKKRLFTFHVHWVCSKICLPSASLNTVCINTCQSLYVTAASAAARRRFRHQPACHDGSCRSASSPPSTPFDSRWFDLIIEPFMKISADQWIHQHQYLYHSYCVLCIYRLMLMLTDFTLALLLHANTLACIILTECQSAFPASSAGYDVNVPANRRHIWGRSGRQVVHPPARYVPAGSV